MASRNRITPAHDSILDAKIITLKGHERITNQSLEEKLKRENGGV